MTGLLDVSGLTVVYRTRSRDAMLRVEPRPAVKDVAFQLHAGQTVALVGESGSGKSTIGRAILGLVPATGSVRFRDVEMLGLKGRQLRAARRGAQMIFQDPYGSLDPRWTVARIVSEALPSLRGERRAARIDELLDAVGLPRQVRERRPAQLSGGQRQRVAIARVLATEPDFLVCDEPTSALDVTVAARIIGLLRQLQERTGVAYLFISHDLSLVRHFAHDVVVMEKGRAVEVGRVDTVLDRPREPYTQVLLAAATSYSLDGFLGAGRG